MTKKIYALFASPVAVVLALASAGPASTAAHDGHQHQHGEQHAADRHARRRATKAQKRARKRARRAVGYACPMHPDMRSKSRGECPKCGMELAAMRRGRA